MRGTWARRLTVGLVLLGGAGLTGGACGDDSKGISKADYLARAREICRKGNETLTAASNDALSNVPPGQKLSDADLENFVRSTVIPTIRDQVRQLRALEAPKGERARLDEIYAALDRGLDELEKAPSKLTDGSNVFAEADKLAEKYGIAVCAQNS